MFKDSAGFTLLEVLIATVVLAISLSGLYVLLRSSIKTTQATLTKVELLEASSDLIYRAYKERGVFTEMGLFENLDGYSGVKYKITSKPLGVFDIKQYTIEVKKNDYQVELHYYK
ncbi:MAG: prepilin-type N-terminal cleavage/methylation domain-containing protein [Nitrospirae bacterium]|nr:prepilin-type N-terminal cleavage/methylation domain-containing protein [Nitrospirota bacterium]